MRTSGEYAQDAHDSLDAADEHYEEYSEGDKITHMEAVEYHLRYAQVEATLAVAAALVNLARIQGGPL